MEYKDQLARASDKNPEQYEAPKQESKPRRSKPEAYKNISRVDVHMCGQRVKRGGSYELTADDKKQTRSMKKLERAVELGLIEKV